MIGPLASFVFLAVAGSGWLNCRILLEFTSLGHHIIVLQGEMAGNRAFLVIGIWWC